MPDRTTTRAALITGGSSGIGLAVAAAMIEDGHVVTICGRDAGRLDQAERRLAHPDHVFAVTADVTSADDVERLIALHGERYGRLDVLVQCAGAVDLGGVADRSVASLDAMLDANVRSMWQIASAAAPMLRRAGAEHGQALVAAVGSILGRHAAGVTAAYSTSKAAVFALMQALHEELAADGVRATTIAPAFVATPMTEPLAHLDRDAMIKPQDVAEAVRFLTRLSPSCAVPEILMLRNEDRLLPL